MTRFMRSDLGHRTSASAPIVYNEEQRHKPQTIMKNVADILGRLRSESAREPTNRIHGITSLESSLPDDLNLEIAQRREAMLPRRAKLRFERRLRCATISIPCSVKTRFDRSSRLADVR